MKKNNRLPLTKLKLLVDDCLELAMSQFLSKEDLRKEHDRLVKEIMEQANKLRFSNGKFTSP